MATVSVSQARSRFAEIIDRVAAGEQITVTRHDQPVAVITAPHRSTGRRRAVVEALDRAARLRRDLDAARDEPLSALGATGAERADDRTRDVRRERDEDVWTPSTRTS